MQNVLIVIHLIITIALIGVVLMQRSEGGALGIGGGSGNLFTSRGVGNALTRATAFLAVCFFVTSIVLAVLGSQRGTSDIFEGVAPSSQSAPAPGAPSSGGDLLPKLDGQTQPAQPKVPTGQ